MYHLKGNEQNNSENQKQLNCTRLTPAGINSSPKLDSSAIQFHLSPREARKIFNSMVQRGKNPIVSTNKTPLHGYAANGALADMHDFLDLMVRDGVSFYHHVFNILIWGYAKRQMVDEAMLIFTKMRQQGLNPVVVNYGTAIDGLCKIGRVDDVMSQFNQMIQQGLIPDIIVFNTLIHGLCACGTWEKAEELAFEMINGGIHPNSVFFNSIMSNLCKGRVMEAQNFFDLMVRAGGKSDVSYTTLIDGYCLETFCLRSIYL
ncbi:protein Rf1, mitochondrial-like [Phragmites australis]|uniref:protein Rf1, mitochondrial-like n=1 Tax=Phragmites australis TaxID=29695 RepID=UPI002D776CFF|nr:protein Rf1, mitochondrial-like [Phragmites australis]